MYTGFKTYHNLDVDDNDDLVEEDLGMREQAEGAGGSQEAPEVLPVPG